MTDPTPTDVPADPFPSPTPSPAPEPYKPDGWPFTDTLTQGAEDWAKAYGVTFVAEFVRHGTMGWEDSREPHKGPNGKPIREDTRDIYRIRFSRLRVEGHQTREVTFTIPEFGQSLNESFYRGDINRGPFWDEMRTKARRDGWDGYGDPRRVVSRKGYPRVYPKPGRKGDGVPDVYSALCCILRAEPGTHRDWCADMGIDTDSRAGLENYLKLQEQYHEWVAFCSGWVPEDAPKGLSMLGTSREFA